MLGREDDARDATQETFLAAFETCAPSAAKQKFRRGFIASLSTSALHDSAGKGQEGKRARRGRGKDAASFAAPLKYSPARVAEGRKNYAASDGR